MIAVIVLVVLTLFCSSCQSQDVKPKRIDMSTLNPKVVGVVLKASGKKYFISSELCPGGIFLTRPVNENCLCYNGIFQIVRQCCAADSSTRITSDSLEWRMDFKCGSLPQPEGSGSGNQPIRAILPLSKPYNRFSSVVTLRSFTGNNTVRWRKYDTDDVIIRNDAQIKLNGKDEFEIINLKPLGREIRIMIGGSGDTAICYAGWFTEHANQNIRVKLIAGGSTAASGCCLNITKENTPGEVTSNCSRATIKTEIVDVQSADMDIGQCDQDINGDSVRSLRKRDESEFETIHFMRGPNSPMLIFKRQIQPDVPFKPLANSDIGDNNVLVQNSQNTRNNLLNDGGEDDDYDTSNITSPGGDVRINNRIIEPENPNPTSEPRVVHPPPTYIALPRKKGISKASFREQAYAINEFIAIIRNDLTVEIREPQTYRFQLLKKSFDVFLAVIPAKVIPPILVKTAFDVFYYLYEELDAILYSPPEVFGRTMGYLDACMNQRELEFTTYGCPSEIDNLVVNENIMQKLQSIYEGHPEQLQETLKALKHVQIKKDRRFIPEKNDIYVEINWKVVDFVHSFCFQHFAAEFNAHHFYESELEKLFLFPEVQQRWFANVKDLRYVRGVFPVSDLKMRMKELDKVTAIGHSLSRYNGTYWLFRPSIVLSAQQKTFKARDSAAHEEKRLAFAQNMLEGGVFQVADRNKIAARSGRVSSTERDVIYPFQFPEKLPAGELIWDGLAVCLHAGYSNRRSYFMDSNLWGIVPSLLDLGKLYP